MEKPEDAPCGPYVRKVLNRAKQMEKGEWRAAVLLQVGLMTIGILCVAIALGLQVVWEQTRFDVYVLGFAMIVLGISRGLFFLWRAPIVIDAEQTASIADFEAKSARKLLLFYDADDDQHRHIYRENSQKASIRIGLRNLSEIQPVRGVTVRFKSFIPISPDDTDTRHKAARLTNAMLVIQHKQPSVESFTLAPTQSLNLNIVDFVDGRKQLSSLKASSVQHKSTSPPQFKFFHSRANGNGHDLLPCGHYRIAVEAFAENSTPAEMEFDVNWSTQTGITLVQADPSAVPAATQS